MGVVLRAERCGPCPYSFSSATYASYSAAVIRSSSSSRSLDLDHPAVTVGILVHHLRVFGQIVVDFQHRAADGCVDVRHGLDGFDHAKRIFLAHLVADGG
jgi:hypothetical protein